MLEDKQNIDDVFSDALGEYQEEVPYYSWTNIQDSLRYLRRKKRLNILKNAGIFVAIVLTFVLGYWASNYNLYEKGEALYLKTIHRNTVVTYRANINHAEDVVNTRDNDTKIIYSTKQKIAIDNYKNKVDKSKLEDKYYQHKTVNISSRKIKKEAKQRNTKQYNQLLTDALLCKDESHQSDGSHLLDNKSAQSNWSFGAKFSPIYSIDVFGESKDNSSDNYMYAQKNGIGKVSSEILSAYTGGINVNYRLSKRFSIESGVFYSTRKQLSTMSGIESTHTTARANPKDIINDNVLYYCRILS